jgi:hypothetical protein
MALMPWRRPRPATDAPGWRACLTSQRLKASAKTRLPLLMTRFTVGPVQSGVCPLFNIADTSLTAHASKAMRFRPYAYGASAAHRLEHHHAQD